MFAAQNSPIAIDFGSSSVKLLQIQPGERPSILAAVGLRLPDEVRQNRDAEIAFMEKQLPRMLRKGGFKGRRVICSIPSADTMVQHIQVANTEGVDRDDVVKAQLAAQLNLNAYGMVIRTYDVTEVNRDGETLSEVICFIISRDVVMRYVELLQRCKLETVGVHSEVIGMVRAFDNIQVTEGNEPKTTLYVDLGWGSTKVAITHDTQLVFARCIQMGGQHVDQRMAERLGCDAASARAQRISEQVLASSSGAGGKSKKKAAAGVATEDNGNGSDLELTEMAHAIADELSMGIRYHGSLFRGGQIDRMIFLGGEARNIVLCQQIAKELRLPAQLGDPLTRLEAKKSLRTPGLSLGQPQPGWAVVCGLCVAPTDL